MLDPLLDPPSLSRALRTATAAIFSMALAVNSGEFDKDEFYWGGTQGDGVTCSPVLLSPRLDEHLGCLP